jgi:predicted nucleic acid-binding protein
VIVHLDTSALVDALSSAHGRGRLAACFGRGDVLVLSTIVLAEWLRGPRSSTQLAEAGELFPAAAAVPFDVEAARTAARLYTRLPRARARQIDIMIAACAIEHGAALWTLNADDFRDIPGLTLYGSPA